VPIEEEMQRTGMSRMDVVKSMRWFRRVNWDKVMSEGGGDGDDDFDSDNYRGKIEIDLESLKSVSTNGSTSTGIKSGKKSKKNRGGLNVGGWSEGSELLSNLSAAERRSKLNRDGGETSASGGSESDRKSLSRKSKKSGSKVSKSKNSKSSSSGRKSKKSSKKKS